MFVGRWKIRNDHLGTGPFGNIQKALCGLFHTKEVQQQSYAGNPEALVPKNDKKADQNTPEIGRKLGRANIEVLQDVLYEGVQRKAETVLEGRFKEADHLRNLDDVGGEKIRPLDMNSRRGSIAGNKSFFTKGLDRTRTHNVPILHGNPQIFGTTRVPNLTNLSLALAKRGWMIHWRGSIDKDGKTTGSTVGPF